jgi:hypothetical protein
MKILKYRLHPGMNMIPVADDNIARLVHLDDQDGKIMGWVELRPTEGIPQAEYEIYLALTGEEIPDEYRYVISHQVNTGGGWFVVHAYD